MFEWDKLVNDMRDVCSSFPTEGLPILTAGFVYAHSPENGLQLFTGTHSQFPIFDYYSK